MAVLRTEEGIPLYTNMIRGLNDRFLNRNHKLNLTHARPSRFVPLHDPYIYPWYYANPPADVSSSSSSSEEFFESSSDLPCNTPKIYTRLMLRRIDFGSVTAAMERKA